MRGFKQRPSPAPAGPRGRLSLRGYVLALGALLVLSMFGGATFVRIQAENQARQAAYSDSSFAAQASAKRIGTDLTQLQSAVAGLAATPGLGALFSPKATCSLSFGGVGELSPGHLDLVNLDGSVACSSSHRTGGPLYASAPWMEPALYGKILVAPYTDPSTGVPVAISAAPVPGHGAVVGFVDLAQLGPALEAIYGGSTHSEVLVTTANSLVVVGRSINPQKWVGAAVPAAVVAAGDAPGEHNDVDGTTRIYSEATIPGVGWHIFVGEDESAALAAALALSNENIGLIAAAGLLVLVGLYIIYRRITLPITRLDNAVRTARTGDAFTPIAVAGPAEVATLAASYNEAMTAIDRELTQRRETETQLGESLASLEIIDAQRRRLLDKLVTAQEEERRRIASDVHDDSIQVMTAAVMRVSLMRQQPLGPAQDAQFAKLEQTLDNAVQRLRQLLFQLWPPSLDREGLAAALDEYLTQWTDEARVTYTIDNRLDAEPPRHIRVKLFRIAQEALTNVRKHAHADRVTVTLEQRSDGVLIRIEDDGVGMGPSSSEMSPIGHLGLATMRERAELAGGWCRFESAASGGTVVEAWVPTAEDRAAVA